MGVSDTFPLVVLSIANLVWKLSVHYADWKMTGSGAFSSITLEISNVCVFFLNYSSTGVFYTIIKNLYLIDSFVTL